MKQEIYVVLLNPCVSVAKELYIPLLQGLEDLGKSVKYWSLWCLPLSEAAHRQRQKSSRT